MKPLNRRQRFTQKKSLGQVFLREDWPCQKLADILVQSGVQTVLEIGPGPGILTKVLLGRGLNVTAVEKDDQLADRLREQQESMSEHSKFEIIHQDILKFNLEQWIEEHPGQKLAVCGNVPYNISSPILMWLLPHLEKLKTATMMVQLEFGERVAASHSTKSYGSLTVYTQLRSKVKLDYMVPRACFKPVPKVDSAVISLKPLSDKQPDSLLKLVEQITRRSFSQRRKKMSNSLSNLLQNVPANEIPVDLNRRCETMSPEEFLSIARIIETYNPPEA